MLLHANAKLGLAGRLALVRAVEDGCSLRAAAAPLARTRRTWASQSGSSAKRLGFRRRNSATAPASTEITSEASSAASSTRIYSSPVKLSLALWTSTSAIVATAEQ